MPLAVKLRALIRGLGGLAADCTCCGNPPPVGYNCVSAECVAAYSGSATYSTLAACQAQCKCQSSSDCPSGEQCLDNECKPPCQVNEDCPSGYECIDGDCSDPCPTLPKVYCCYTDSTKTSFRCQLSPCASGLYRGGPYCTSVECESACQMFSCNRTTYVCSPDPNGTYKGVEDCRRNCTPSACEDDGPCGGPVAVSSGGVGITSRVFPTPKKAAIIRVTYDAKFIPDRFQIWAPVLNALGQVIANRVIKADSNYRGDQVVADQNCADKIKVRGGGQGFIQWNKPYGVCSVEVQVIAPCESTVWSYIYSCELNGAP